MWSSAGWLSEVIFSTDDLKTCIANFRFDQTRAQLRDVRPASREIPRRQIAELDRQ